MRDREGCVMSISTIMFGFVCHSGGVLSNSGVSESWVLDPSGFSRLGCQLLGKSKGFRRLGTIRILNYMDTVWKTPFEVENLGHSDKWRKANKVENH